MYSPIKQQPMKEVSDRPVDVEIDSKQITTYH